MQASCQIVEIEVYNLPCGRSLDDCVQHEEQKQPGQKPAEMKAGKGKEKDVAPRGHMTCTLSLCIFQKLLNILTWSEGWQDNFRQSKVVSKVLAAVGHILQVIYILCSMLLHACMPRPHRGILGHPCFAWFIVIFDVCITPFLVLYHTYSAL